MPGRGRGSGGIRKNGLIPGQDRTITANKEPSLLFPQNFRLEAPGKITASDRKTLQHYTSIKRKIRNETPYCVTDSVASTHQGSNNVRRYSDRFREKETKLPSFMDMKLDASLFPLELRPLIDSTIHTKRGNMTSKKIRKKRVLHLGVDDEIDPPSNDQENEDGIASSGEGDEDDDDQIDDENFENIEEAFDNGEEEDYGEDDGNDEAVM